MLRSPAAVEAAMHAEVADGVIVGNRLDGVAFDCNVVQLQISSGHICGIFPGISPHELALVVIEVEQIESHEIVHPIVLDAHVGE